MNSKSTLWLMFLALGLFAYILFFERHTLDTEQRAERAMKLFSDFDPTKIDSAEILRSNNVIRAERMNDQWRLVQPVVYPAQGTAVENWLSLFGSLNRRDYISARELLDQPGGLQDFGLDSPQATVVIQQGPRRIQLRLGAKTPVGEKLYLQQVGSDGVFITDSALLDRLPQSATDWRDPTFLNLAGLKFDRLSVRAGVGDFTVQRSFPGQLWRLSYPRQARTDSGLVQQVLQQLQTLRVDQFVSDTPGGDLEPYGLQTPEVSVVFGLGTNNLLTVEFGKSPTNNPMQIFARRSTYSNIVIVPRQILDLLRRPYTDFLDKRLLEFAPAAVDRIEVQAAESFALQKQANGAWRIAEPYQAPADPALVKGFLDRLNSIQIVDLVKEVVTESALPEYGLSPPVRQYILQTSSPVANTNQLLARIDFGTNQADKIFVRRIDENSVYSTRLEESQLLPQAAFELRDRRVWSFTTNQATGITITFNSKTYKLKRNSSGQWAFAPGSQGIINTFALEEAVFRLGQQLWSKHWVARNDINRARFGFSDPPHRLSIEVNNGDKPGMLTVEFGIQSPSGGPFALVDLDGGSTVFEFPFEIFHVYSEVVRGLTATASATP